MNALDLKYTHLRFKDGVSDKVYIVVDLTNLPVTYDTVVCLYGKSGNPNRYSSKRGELAHRIVSTKKNKGYSEVPEYEDNSTELDNAAEKLGEYLFDAGIRRCGKIEVDKHVKLFWLVDAEYDQPEDAPKATVSDKFEWAGDWA